LKQKVEILRDAKETRWRGYEKLPFRDIYFIGVSDFIPPAEEKVQRYTIKTKKQVLGITKYISYIMGKDYKDAFEYTISKKKNEDVLVGLEKDSTAVIPKWKQTLKKFRIDVDEAAMYYKRTNEPQAWNALAYLQEKNGMIADAKATIDSAFVYIPDNADIVNNRNKLTSRVQVEQFMPLYAEAVNYYNTQRFDEAAKVFSAFLEKVPAHIEAYRLRAFCYYNLGQYQKVIADINQIEALGVVVDPVLNNYRGSCYYMLGNKANAKVYFEKAANEGNADAKKNLSTLSF